MVKNLPLYFVLAIYLFENSISNFVGEFNDELIVHTLLENKTPCVRELDDDNFEHITQVTTGATTGDWFILLLVLITYVYLSSSYTSSHTFVFCE